MKFDRTAKLDDKHDETKTESERIKTCLRMNVLNVKSLADKLTGKNVKVDYQELRGRLQIRLRPGPVENRGCPRQICRHWKNH